MQNTKTRKATKKIYKVEFADKELNFLNDVTFEAADDFEAWDLAENIAERRYGYLLDLYLIDRKTGDLLRCAV